MRIFLLVVLMLFINVLPANANYYSDHMAQVRYEMDRLQQQQFQQNMYYDQQQAASRQYMQNMQMQMQMNTPRFDTGINSNYNWSNGNRQMRLDSNVSRWY